MSEILKCFQCDMNVDNPIVERVELPNDKFHLKASCPKCGRYLKFLSQGPPGMHFGKYKGFTVVEMVAKDAEYARWLTGQSWCKPKLKREIESALSL